MKLLLISDALQGAGGDGFALHPSLGGFADELAARRRQWFSCSTNNPLGWYAALAGISPSALLAPSCTDLSAAAQQLWVASPFHAVPGRDSVRLLPESELPWDTHDAEWLCSELDLLLGEEGMALHTCGAALLLSCEQPIDAEPVPFTVIAGGALPNRHPAGKDGGRLMRLLAEIQMSLHGREQRTRHGKPAVNGLWPWGPCALPCELPGKLLPVASPDPWIQELQGDGNAGLSISTSDQLSTWLPGGGLPKTVLLAGAGHAVLLRPGLLPNLSKGWLPKSPLGEESLIARLGELARAG